MSIVGTDEMLDRIDELEAERDHWEAVAIARQARGIVLAQKLDAAEAELTKAMGAMETAIDTMDKPHYGCRDNQLDNACDARNGLVYILQELIEYQEKGMKNE